MKLYFYKLWNMSSIRFLQPGKKNHGKCFVDSRARRSASKLRQKYRLRLYFGIRLGQQMALETFLNNNSIATQSRDMV